MTVSDIKRKFPKRKVILGIILSVLIVLIAIGGTLILRDHIERQELKAIQSEKLQELLNRRGEYDEQSIMLTNTSKGAAEDLATRTGAALRITKDGSFATLTLPDGVTILDVYSSEEYLEDIHLEPSNHL